MSDYPRDLIGYGANPPHAKWPGNARLAVQFVLADLYLFCKSHLKKQT